MPELKNKIAKESTLKAYLRATNNRASALVVFSGTLILGIMDYTANNSTGVFIRKLSLERAEIVAVIAVVGLLLYILTRRQAARFTIWRYVYLNLAMFYVLAYFLPVPSPYLLFVMVLPLLVYFNYGAKAAYITVIIWYLALVGRLAQLQLLGTREYGMFVVYFIIGALFLYYVLNVLKIADNERKALEELGVATERERSQLLTLVKNLNDAILACDTDFNVLLSNPQASKLLAIQGGLPGNHIDDLIDLRDDKGQPVKLSELVAASPNEHVHVFTSYKKYYAEKDSVNLYIAVSRIDSNDDSSGGYVILLRDITKLKSLEYERNEFISIMSHELRTPVSVLEGGISLAQDFYRQGKQEKVGEFLEKTYAQVLRLADVVNSLSTLTTSDDEQPVFEEFEPGSVAETLKTAYQPKAESKSLQLVIQVADGLPGLYSNEQRVVQILHNLMENAITYTKKGTVTLSVAGYDDHHVEFRVKDTGVGISKSDQTHLFEKFWRSEDYHTRESGGIGMGLYNARRQADSIGATVTVNSELGEGATFTLIVPVHAKPEL